MHGAETALGIIDKSVSIISTQSVFTGKTLLNHLFMKNYVKSIKILSIHIFAFIQTLENSLELGQIITKMIELCWFYCCDWGNVGNQGSKMPLIHTEKSFPQLH